MINNKCAFVSCEYDRKIRQTQQHRIRAMSARHRPFLRPGYRHLIHDCTMHHIPMAKIEAAILAVIQRVSWYIRHNEKEFTESKAIRLVHGR